MSSKKTVADSGVNSPLVASIVVAYENADDVINISRQLQQIPFTGHRLIVVDNHSSAACSEQVAEFCQANQIQYVRSEANGGYGAGINTGAALASQADYLHIINADTEILDGSYIKRIVSLMEGDSSLAMVGPIVKRPDQSIQNTVMPFFSLPSIFYNYRADANYDFSSKDYCGVDVINGVCAVIRRSCFEEAGGFDERYFMYGEEHDLCMKLHKLGYRMAIFNCTAIVHKENALTSHKEFDWRDVYIRRNQVLFCRKYKGYLYATLVAAVFSFALIYKLKIRRKKTSISLRSALKQYWGILKL